MSPQPNTVSTPASPCQSCANTHYRIHAATRATILRVAVTVTATCTRCSHIQRFTSECHLLPGLRRITAPIATTANRAKRWLTSTRPTRTDQPPHHRQAQTA